MKLGEAFIEIRPDHSRFGPDLQKGVEGPAQRTAASLRAAFTGEFDTIAQRSVALGDRMSRNITLPVVAGFALMTNAASDLGEQVAQSEQIFGGLTDKIGTFAETAATSLGQSERAAREAANGFGLFFTNAGVAQDEAADMSITLTQLASDAASFKNTRPEEAVEAFSAALRGESEPIRAYGVMLDEATLKQRAMSMGLIENTTAVLPPQIRMMAAYQEILAQTATIQGDFERTSDGAANQQRILRARLEDTGAEMGQKLLPAALKLADGVGVVLDVFDAMPDSAQTAVIGFGALAAAAGPVLSIGGRLATTWDKVVTGIENTRGPQAAANLNAIAQGAAAAGIAVTGLMTAYSLYQNALESQRGDVREQAEGWRTALDLQGSSYDDLSAKLGTINDEINRTNANIEGSEAPWDADYRAGLKQGLSELSGLRKETSDLLGNADRLAAQMGITGQEALTLLQNEQVLGAGLDEATGHFDSQTAAVEANVVALQDLSKELAAQLDPLFGAQDALQGLQDAQTRVAEAVLANRDANADNNVSQEDMNRLNREAVDAAFAWEQKLIALKAAIENNDVSLQDAKGTMQLWADQGLITQTQADDAKYSFDLLGTAADNLDGKNVLITADADTSKAETKLSALAEMLIALATGNITVTAPTSGIDPLLRELLLPPGTRPTKHAAGGAVFDGDFLVGEAGVPELLRKRGSSVEVVAGSPTQLADVGGSDLISAENLATLRSIEALLAQIAGNTAGPTTGQRLRRVQTMAGAI